MEAQDKKLTCYKSKLNRDDRQAIVRESVDSLFNKSENLIREKFTCLVEKVVEQNLPPMLSSTYKTLMDRHLFNTNYNAQIYLTESRSWKDRTSINLTRGVPSDRGIQFVFSKSTEGVLVLETANDTKIEIPKGELYDSLLETVTEYEAHIKARTEARETIEKVVWSFTNGNRLAEAYEDLQQFIPMKEDHRPGDNALVTIGLQEKIKSLFKPTSDKEATDAKA